VLYYSAFEVGEKQTMELCLSEKAFYKPNEFDFIPTVFFRIRRPLLPKKSLPTINPDLIFYHEGPSFKYNLTAYTTLPHYSNKDTLKAMIYMGESKNTSLKDLYHFIIQGQFNREIWRKVEEFLVDFPEQEKLRSLDETFANKEKEIKAFLVDQNKALDEAMKKVVKAMPFLDENNFTQVSAILFIMTKYFSYGMKIYERLSNRQVKNQVYDGLVIKRRQFIQQLPGFFKNEFVRKQIETLPKGEQTGITIRRRKALGFANAGNVDHAGTVSMVGQMIQQIKQDYDKKSKCFLINKADDCIFKVTFKGEGGSDYGGLYRDFITSICNEMQSKVLPLLIPTPNSKAEHGENRDTYIVNPSSTKPSHLEIFKYFGYLLGMAIRSEQYLPLDLAPLFWKQILDEHLFESEADKEMDLKSVDLYSY